MACVKQFLQVVGILFLLYLASYPLLRLGRFLVRREYTVYVKADEGGRIFVDYIDIGRGSAFDHGVARYDSIVGTLYAPIAGIELRVRGFSPKPKVWLAIESGH
jgi:hypothetical protein